MAGYKSKADVEQKRAEFQAAMKAIESEICRLNGEIEKQIEKRRAIKGEWRKVPKRRTMAEYAESRRTHKYDDILIRLANGERMKDIAAKMGVSGPCVSENAQKQMERQYPELFAQLPYGAHLDKWLRENKELINKD